MRSPPTVSIIIPNKNRCDELVQTLESVRAQTFDSFECIVVDDNSTDALDTAIAPFLADDRFRLIRQPATRAGAPAARNDGMAAARGQWIMFLDSDDLLAPFCLEQRMGFVRDRHDLDFAVFPGELFRKNPGDVGLLWNADTDEPDLDRFIRHDVPWQTTGPIWRRTALSKVGPWDESARSAQDWEFHLRAVLACLRYERFGRVDYYWRLAGPDRASIGKNAALDPQYHLSRLELYRRVFRHVEQAGAMNDFRRRCFAGMYFTAVEKIGQYVSRSQARRLWAAAWNDGLVSRRQWWQGWWLLAQMRWKDRYDRARLLLNLKWPAEFFLPRSATFNRAPKVAISEVPAGGARVEVA